MLFHLLPASITNYYLFSSDFLLLLTVSFTIPVEIENARLKLALTISAGTPIIVANDAIEMLRVLVDKTINYLSKYSKE